MNTFYEHHENSIRFGYRCFDRILINGLIQPFQQPERVVGFFNTYRQLYPVSKPVLTDIATQYQRWVTAQAKAWRRADRRGARGSTGRLRRAVLPPGQAGSGRRHREGARARANPHRDRQRRIAGTSSTRDAGSTSTTFT